MKIVKKQVLSPDKNTPWMDMKVLNPAIIEYEDKMLMLFRATGSLGCEWDDPDALYPISLGFGISEDCGNTWDFDLSRPALSPKCELDIDKVYIKNSDGKKVPNFANGSNEDPRLFMIEDKYYLTVSARQFPMGNLWWDTSLIRMVPDWAENEDNPFGKTAKDNLIVTVLYQVFPEALLKKDYDNAFSYITNLTNPEFGENRDIVFLPKRQMIDGKMQYIMIERPLEPFKNPHLDAKSPSMVFSCGETFYDFAKPDNKKVLIAQPTFQWEAERIGASAPPIKIDDEHWLLCYHGKQDGIVGYTQNFMVFRNQENDFPKLIYHFDERLITVSEDWEKPDEFDIPCTFVTGMIKKDGKLILSYGAGDESVGIMSIDYDQLINHLRENGAEI